LNKTNTGNFGNVYSRKQTNSLYIKSIGGGGGKVRP